MERTAVEELERRSKFLNSLIQKQKQKQNKKKKKKRADRDGDGEVIMKVRASDMAGPMQSHAIKAARAILLHSNPPSSSNLDTKRFALSLKKEFDATYGPAWHCIVGTSFGSYVTHSLGGFLYFSIDHKVYVLLFKTAVKPTRP